MIILSWDFDIKMDKGIEQVKEKIRPILVDFYKKSREKFIPGKSKVAVGSPIFDEKEVLSVLESFLKKRLSQGKYVKKFEKLYSDYIDVKYSAAVNSGTSANLLAMLALIENGKVKTDDEVIIPAATFISVASPVIQAGLKPVFVDVDKNSYNIDPKEVQNAISDKTKVIMPVHSLGNPADMKAIMEIADEKGLYVVEDCCESHGAEIGGKKIGSFGHMSTISYFVAHNITTGEGGMVSTNIEEFNDVIKSLREFGRVSQKDNEKNRFIKDEKLGYYDKRYLHERLGYNLRMTDPEASFGIVQLKKLDEFNDIRIRNAKNLTMSLNQFEKYFQLPTCSSNTKHTFLGYVIVIKPDAPFRREELINYLENNLIETRPFLGGCLPDQPVFRKVDIKVIGNLSVSRNLRDNAFYIGCHPEIGKDQIDYVTDIISSFIKKIDG